MKSLSLSPVAVFLRKFIMVLAAVFAPALAVHAQGDDIGTPVGAPSPVVYNPNTLQSAQGEAPFNFTYALTVTSPSALPANVTTAVSINFAIEAKPAGSSAATALSYISSNQSQLSFTGPNQTRTVNITLQIPSGSETGDFTFLITTVGWPGDPALNIVDNGTRVNARVDPPSGLVAPQVAIASPANGTAYSRPLGGPAIMVPVTVTGSATNNAPLTELSATIAGVNGATTVLSTRPISMVLTGLGTANGMGVVSGGYPINSAGVYTITATARNVVGSSVTSSTFTVDEYLNVVPPTVVITAPAANASFALSYASKTGIKMDFTGASQTYGAVITKLTHQLDGGAVVEVSSSTLNQPTAYGTITLPVTTPGTHTFTVTATDAYGTATATSSFIVVDDTPVYYNLSGIVFNDANLNGVREGSEVGLAGVSMTLKSSAGAIIGTATSGSDGAYSFSVVAGGYTVTAGSVAGYTLTTANNHSVVVTNASVTAPDTGFGVVVQPAPVSLSGIVFYDANSNGVRNSPADYGLSGVSVQLSDAAGVLRSTVTTATDGTYVFSVTPGTYTVSVANVAGLNQTTATPRPYTIVVGGTSAVAPETGFGAPPYSTLTGVVFFDVNFNGIRNTEDYGLGAFTVKLYKAASSTTAIATTTTAANGTYSFANLASGNYVVVVTGIAGLAPTTLNEWSVSANGGAVTVPDTGFGLKFADIKKMSAGGFTIGYWKNNVDKAIAKKTGGVQVSAATIAAYTNAIGSLALDPFAGITMSQASAIMGSSSSAPIDLLKKQLVGSEYNYANGANGGYIGGSQQLTYAFIYWAEYVVKNPSLYSSTYIIWVKDWCDAYNNSHGGLVCGPNP